MPIKTPNQLLTAEGPDDDNNRANTSNDDEFLTTQQLARRWGFSPKTIQEKARKGELQAHDFFGAYRFSKRYVRWYEKEHMIISDNHNGPTGGGIEHTRDAFDSCD